MEGASRTETMIVASARHLAGERVCFVGIGPPNIACNLARRTVAPDLELVYEAGVFGAVPERLPLSIGDPSLVTGAASVCSMFELFSYYLQGGLVDGTPQHKVLMIGHPLFTGLISDKLVRVL